MVRWVQTVPQLHALMFYFLILGNNAYVSHVFEGLSCWFATNSIKNK